MLSELEIIVEDETLFVEKNFIARTQAIDDIELFIIDRLYKSNESDSSEWMASAKKRKYELEAVNTKMFDRLRSEISAGQYRGEKWIALIDEYLDHQLESIRKQRFTGYDDLDAFINGLLTYMELPAETKVREREMVYYQKTPARLVFDLIKQASFQPGDVFYDLGSGLGQVVMMVNLLTSVESKGVEFEPAFCNYAKNCAVGLNLNNVDFINTDARCADYSNGDVFFMYTPFEGDMLSEVLNKLHLVSKKREIRIFTYGPCTPEVDRQIWIRQVDEIKNYDAGLAEFVSI
jgi:hypothetical protein